MSIPTYFTLNDRPVKVIKRAQGGWDVMLLDMHTGDWERDEDEEYLDRYFRSDGDIDILTEDQFNARVADIRAWLEKEKSS